MLEILSRLEELKKIKNVQVVHDTPEINELKIQLTSIEQKINNIIEHIAEGSDISVSYLNKHIEKLDAERSKILEDIAKQDKCIYIFTQFHGFFQSTQSFILTFRIQGIEPAQCV